MPIYADIGLCLSVCIPICPGVRQSRLYNAKSSSAPNGISVASFLQTQFLGPVGLSRTPDGISVAYFLMHIECKILTYLLADSIFGIQALCDSMLGPRYIPPINEL